MYIRMALWCLLLVSVSTHAGARVYKWVDGKGQMHFSDRPISGASEISANGSPIPKLGNRGTVTQQPAQVPAKGVYSSLELVRPKDDEDFYTEKSETRVEFLVLIEPSLQPGHGIRFVLDGNLVPGSFNNSKTTLVIAVGEHKAYAQIVDTENVVQVTSAIVKFRVRPKKSHNNAGQT